MVYSGGGWNITPIKINDKGGIMHPCSTDAQDVPLPPSQALRISLEANQAFTV